MTPAPFLHRIATGIAVLLARACPGVACPGLVVALSGGPDSVALLLAAVRWRAQTGGGLAAAHLNHGLRGEAADRDEAFCAELCARLDVRLIVDRQDPRPLARSRGCGLEEAGRHLRRRFLATVLDAEPALDAAATGHHRDDQAETVIMRLLRGTGPDGLRGIRPVSGRIIHPLLGVGRAEIVAFLADAGQPWREDASNTGGTNLRARLRRELLPVARSLFGPGCDEAAVRLASLLDDDLELLDGLTARALAACADGPALRVDELATLPRALARRVLRRWLEPGGEADGPVRSLALTHLEAVLGLLEAGRSGAAVDLPDGRRIVRRFDRLLPATDVPRPRRAADYRIVVRRDAPQGAPEAAGSPPGHGEPDDEATWRLACPADALQGNLRVRGWRRGDRIASFGLDGTKKLSDLFRERRLPAGTREGVLVVEDDGGILWVVGLARAERTRLLPGGGPTVTLTVARR
ncbi:MAG: tRNA lysidine(34) synthetase TilS [Candidatus Krumholzibacteriia bacterium]